MAQIKAQVEETTSDYDKEKLQERLAKLSGGVAVIKVGAATEVELKEKKHRIEDALSATRAAIDEGIVAGGGTALVRSRAAVTKLAGELEGDEATGARMVARSLESPLKQIAENAGMEGGVVVEKVRNLKGSEGLNAATGDYVDLVKLGVIDAAKVTRSALHNAASIAALFLTTEVVIADAPEKKAGGAPGGGMPDMDEFQSLVARAADFDWHVVLHFDAIDLVGDRLGMISYDLVWIYGILIMNMATPWTYAT